MWRRHGHKAIASRLSQVVKFGIYKPNITKAKLMFKKCHTGDDIDR